MCMYIYRYVYISVYVYISLSLYIYVYMYSAPRHVLPRALLAPGLLDVELVAQIVVVDRYLYPCIHAYL